MSDDSCGRCKYYRPHTGRFAQPDTGACYRFPPRDGPKRRDDVSANADWCGEFAAVAAGQKDDSVSSHSEELNTIYAEGAKYLEANAKQIEGKAPNQ